MDKIDIGEEDRDEYERYSAGEAARAQAEAEQPQGADLRESIARSWCPMPWYKAGMVVRRDSLLMADDVIKMFEAAGYHRCQKVEWPVPEIPCENCPAPSQGKEILVPDGRELRLATAPCPESESCATYHNWLGRVEQLREDMKQCPAQE